MIKKVFLGSLRSLAATSGISFDIRPSVFSEFGLGAP